MIPPYFQRGVSISVDRLNQMIDLIRQSLIQPGPGYLFSRNWGGTTLYIEPGGGAGSAAAAATPCPFEVTDVSEPGSGGELTLKVEIQYGLVANRIPDGMVLGIPYKLTFDGTENFYVFCVLDFNPDTLQLADETSAITFELSKNLKPNTTTTTYTVVAIVEVSATGGPANGPYIKNIQNTCKQIIPNPCDLAWETTP